MTELTTTAARRGYLTPGLAVLGLAIAGALAGPVASANTLEINDSPLLVGSDLRVYSMNLSSSGSLSVHLADLNFPTALGDLSFALVTAGGVLERAAAGDTLMNISGPGTYWGVVSGVGLGKFGVGQLSLHVEFSPLAGPVPVPLPGAMVLLLAGLAGTYGFNRRRSPQTPGG